MLPRHHTTRASLFTSLQTEHSKHMKQVCDLLKKKIQKHRWAMVSRMVGCGEQS